MIDALAALLIGAAIGWFGSLAMRPGTQAGILWAILAGMLGGILAPLLINSGYTFDNLVAAALGALVLVVILALSRRLLPGFGPAGGGD